MRDISPSKKTKTIPFDGVAADNELFNIIEEEAKNIRVPITLTSFGDVIPKGFRYREINFRGKKTRGVTVLGAAGETQVPIQKLKIISDPYTAETRRDFTNLALTDPVMAPAIAFRRGALFEDGFILKLKLASQYNPDTGQEYTPEEIQTSIQQHFQTYSKFLLQLNTWKNEMALELVAKDFETVSIPHGKAGGLIYPGLLELEPGKLPILFEIIPADDLGDPVIDVSLTRQIVACKLNLDDKKYARKDELVYFTRGVGGLRREFKFQGTSLFEPILIISKAIKRFYNLDAPMALIAAYLTRTLIKVQSEGDPTDLENRIKEFMSNVFKASNWATAMPEWFAGVEKIEPKVDYPMFQGIEEKLANIELAQLGVPKATQNREKDVNRDTFTIQAINFIRFIRKPAEKEIKEALENQLLNPLFAHLAQKPLSEIPVRVEIVRKTPEEGDIDSIYDKLTQKKDEEINKQTIIQDDAKSPFGASGGFMEAMENKFTKLSSEIAKVNEQVTYQNFLLKQKKSDVLDSAKTALANLIQT